MDYFLTRALLGGLGLAIIAGPLGSLLVWRRMSYFGDTLAHSTLLGMSLSLLLNIHPYIGLIGLCLIVAALLTALSQYRHLASDALLGMIAHTTLAAGLIAATRLPGARLDLLAYLYGDILAITKGDLLGIFVIDIGVLFILFKIWRPLLSISLDEALAQVEGVPVLRHKAIFMLLLAVVFALAMKLVGVLLTTALLIIPPSASRQWAKTPEQMALGASIIGIIAVASGLGLSQQWDWPTGPAIVIGAAACFGLSLCLKMSGLLKEKEK